MGHINFSTRAQLLGTLGEVVGFKAGLALDQAAFVGHAPGFERQLSGDLDQPVRLHSYNYEALVVGILYQLGHRESDSTDNIGIRLFAKYHKDPERLEIVNFVLHEYSSCVRDHMLQPEAQRPSLIDPSRFIKAAGERFGVQGLKMAMELIEGANRDVRDSPHSPVRRLQWNDTLELAELFESESLEVAHGDFFDQRFIDYLERNFDSIDRINWRKFEGLAGEYFERQGLCVEMGAGRNDDGVDLRVWSDTEEVRPTIIVQCKRTRAKVGKVVVKALWTDVVEEGAASGMIVTTSSLAPGAKKTCEARQYAIEEVDRSTLQLWVREMRTPFTGVFLSE